MTQLVTPLLILSTVLAYTFSSLFSKLFAVNYKGDDRLVTPVFVSVFGLIVAFCVWVCGCKMQFHASPATWTLGLINGVILFVYNFGVLGASRTGPYSLQNIVKCAGNVLVPMLFSVIYWGDELSVMQMVGIGIMLAAFVVINGKGLLKSTVSRIFLVWLVVLFVSNGIFGIVTDAQQRVMQQTERSEMIVITYAFASVCALGYMAIAERKALSHAYRMGKTCVFDILGCGATTSLAVYLFMMLLGRVNSSVMFTINNGGVLVLSVILSAILLKEKLNKNIIYGSILTVLSIIALSL